VNRGDELVARASKLYPERAERFRLVRAYMKAAEDAEGISEVCEAFREDALLMFEEFSRSRSRRRGFGP
jgi:mevalonate pyrophosphate decarboxylase